MNTKQIVVILLVISIIFSAVTLALNVSFGKGIGSFTNVQEGNSADNGSGRVSLTITEPAGGTG